MTSRSLYVQIIGFMDEAERHYQTVEDSDCTLIVAEIGGDDGSWKTYIQVTDTDENRLVVIHAHLPARIPEVNRLKVAELLTRINYDLIVGNFELNLDDGAVLFKTTLDLADGELTQAMFERMYETNGSVMNGYYAKILAAGYGSDLIVPEAVESRPEGVVLQ